MKTLLLIAITFFIVGCDNIYKKIENKDDIKIVLDKKSINLIFVEKNNLKKVKKVKKIKRTLKEKKKISEIYAIYNWEYMYLFLMNTYVYKTEKTHVAFSNLVKSLRAQKINDIKVLEEILKKKIVNIDKPTLSLEGSCSFKDDRINKAFKIFNKAKEKKDMYKYLCIGTNSIIYKYSKLEEKETNVLDNSLYKIMENQNIKQLLLIDKTLKKININGCCEVSGILCPKIKK